LIEVGPKRCPKTVTFFDRFRVFRLQCLAERSQNGSLRYQLDFLRILRRFWYRIHAEYIDLGIQIVSKSISVRGVKLVPKDFFFCLRNRGYRGLLQGSDPQVSYIYLYKFPHTFRLTVSLDPFGLNTRSCWYPYKQLNLSLTLSLYIYIRSVPNCRSTKNRFEHSELEVRPSQFLSSEYFDCLPFKIVSCELFRCGKMISEAVRIFYALIIKKWILPPEANQRG
jgi:hypothetical protein